MGISCCQGAAVGIILLYGDSRGNIIGIMEKKMETHYLRAWGVKVTRVRKPYSLPYTHIITGLLLGLGYYPL